MLLRRQYYLLGAAMLSFMVTNCIIFNAKYLSVKSVCPGKPLTVVVDTAHDRTISPAQPYNAAVTQALRRHTLRQACSSLGFYKDSLYGRPIPHPSYSPNIRVLEKFQTAICLIPKVGSSSWVGTLLILDGILNSTSGMSTKKIVQASKKGVKSFANFNDGKRLAMLRNFTTVLFVRNPYTRLLSAFRERLETFPNNNLFHRRKHSKKIYTMFGNHSAYEMPGSSVKSELYNVTFKAFVDYYLSGVTDIHWREQHKVCPPCLDYDYIGKAETFEEDYNAVLRLIGADRKVPLIKAAHATHSSNGDLLKKYYGTLTREQLERLGKVLLPDMKLYGYDVPEEIQVIY